MRAGAVVEHLPDSAPALAREPRKTDRLLPGAILEVRPWEQIAATLDENGMLEALPFMPEMLQYCGRQFTVTKRLERTCEETEGSMRRIRGTVFLGDLRCDGLAHGGCQKGCRIFWKEAWLRPAKGCKDEGGCKSHPNLSPHSPSAPEQYVC